MKYKIPYLRRAKYANDPRADHIVLFVHAKSKEEAGKAGGRKLQKKVGLKAGFYQKLYIKKV